MDSETVDALRKHQEAQLLERDFAGDAYTDSDLVFCDELGGAIHPQRLTEWFRRHRKAAGIPTGSLHTLRHSAITLRLTGGVPVHVTAARVGDTPRPCSRPMPTCWINRDAVAAERVAAALAGA